MKINEARGPNSISTKILKLFKKEFSKSLSDIINLSLNQGVFPDLLKIAKVTPIHKKGGTLDCNNYRPISLLTNVNSGVTESEKGGAVSLKKGITNLCKS